MFYVYNMSIGAQANIQKMCKKLDHFSLILLQFKENRKLITIKKKKEN